MKPAFAVVWDRIRANARQSFHTKTGLDFSFVVQGDGLFPSRTKYRVSKEDFRTAYAHAPYDGPGRLNDVVRGPAYVWAILHDRRIRKGDW
jgi:hypothetical protein